MKSNCSSNPPPTNHTCQNFNLKCDIENEHREIITGWECRMVCEPACIELGGGCCRRGLGGAPGGLEGRG